MRRGGSSPAGLPARTLRKAVPWRCFAATGDRQRRPLRDKQAAHPVQPPSGNRASHIGASASAGRLCRPHDRLPVALLWSCRCPAVFCCSAAVPVPSISPECGRSTVENGAGAGSMRHRALPRVRTVQRGPPTSRRSRLGRFVVDLPPGVGRRACRVPLRALAQGRGVCNVQQSDEHAMPRKPLISLMSSNRDMLRRRIDVTRCFCRDTVCRRLRGVCSRADTPAGARGDAALAIRGATAACGECCIPEAAATPASRGRRDRPAPRAPGLGQTT